MNQIDVQLQQNDQYKDDIFRGILSFCVVSRNYLIKCYVKTDSLIFIYLLLSARTLESNTTWKMVVLHQKESPIRSIQTPPQLRSTWLQKAFLMYDLSPGSAFIYWTKYARVRCYHLPFLPNNFSNEISGGYLQNWSNWLFRSWGTVWCWCFWLSKRLCQIDEVCDGHNNHFPINYNLMTFFSIFIALHSH